MRCARLSFLLSASSTFSVFSVVQPTLLAVQRAEAVAVSFADRGNH